jgi:hypothetical protein
VKDEGDDLEMKVVHGSQLRQVCPSHSTVYGLGSRSCAGVRGPLARLQLNESSQLSANDRVDSSAVARAHHAPSFAFRSFEFFQLPT